MVALISPIRLFGILKCAIITYRCFLRILPYAFGNYKNIWCISSLSSQPFSNKILTLNILSLIDFPVLNTASYTPIIS